MKYLSLKSAKASKIGQRSQGDIHYRILTDQALKQLYIIITGNDDIGYYSKEVVLFEKVEQCIEGIKPNSPISSKLFKSAFIGQSNNNAAFMAAILRNEKLLVPMTDAVKKHSIAPGWDIWKAGLLSNKGKPFEPESVKPKIAITDTADLDGSELDDADLALLDRSVLEVDSGEDEAEVPAKSRSKKS